MLVVGLTGGIGCGKSIVSDTFHQDFNVPIIDADLIARELSQTEHVTDLIHQNLGAKYFSKDRILQREKLRQAIFSDYRIRDKLEKILHPLVYEEIDRNLKSLNADYCIVVIPLLLETKFKSLIDRILVVDCRIEEQIQRVMSRDQCSETHVKSIISAQIDKGERLKLADDIIGNHGSILSLKKKVAILHKKYSLAAEITKSKCE